VRKYGKESGLPQSCPLASPQTRRQENSARVAADRVHASSRGVYAYKTTAWNRTEGTREKSAAREALIDEMREALMAGARYFSQRRGGSRQCWAVLAGGGKRCAAYRPAGCRVMRVVIR